MTSRRKLGKGEESEKADKTEEKEILEAEEAPQEIEEEVEEETEQPEEETQEVQEETRIVLPGDLIGTSEELTGKTGTFVDKGNIYAATTGIVKINNKERSISITPVTNTPPNLQVGDIVIGQVTDVKDSVALVEIAGIKGRGEREIFNAEQAAIHVSNVKDAYVKELYYEFSPFDIVKARVIDMRNMRLTTVNKELGVMKAYCGNCRTALKKDNGKLKCPKCNRNETRKLSSDYGTGII
ncbi:MAG: RNA-binding protein [Candidatus Methanoperedens sp.]|nr:RNA-binding protein [Candidatus Methanoperedens sp.]